MNAGEVAIRLPGIFPPVKSAGHRAQLRRGRGRIFTVPPPRQFIFSATFDL